jgi:hypothetical protein
VNEVFSGENLPENYNPSQLKKETETDDEGNKTHVDRARFTDLADESEPPESDKSTDSTDIENRESLQNRDRNYDVSPNRYPPSHPDNHTNRGNIEMDRD